MVACCWKVTQTVIRTGDSLTGKRQDTAQNDRSILPAERRRRVARLVRETGSVTVTGLEKEFGVSPMTARRDLKILEREGRVRRTHGGAVLPGFAGHEDSFQWRLEESVEAKRRLAQSAVSLLEPGETVFLDSSTTAYHAARQTLIEGIRVTLLTNLVPTMELFSSSDSPGVEVVGIGGSMRKITRSFVGPHATRMIGAHFADKAFISAKGVTEDGYLTDPDPLEAEVKRAMVAHSGEAVLLVSAEKLEQRGLHVITHVSDFSQVLVSDVSDARLEGLVEAGARARRV
jgi:DeoR/GlpR family transcriptional regulator of sugar metabolism